MAITWRLIKRTYPDGRSGWGIQYKSFFKWVDSVSGFHSSYEEAKRAFDVRTRPPVDEVLEVRRA